MDNRQATKTEQDMRLKPYLMRKGRRVQLSPPVQLQVGDVLERSMIDRVSLEALNKIVSLTQAALT
jgi:hypothetical protein